MLIANQITSNTSNMSNIILFDFENHAIRFVGTAENPWWVADDICKALDLDDTSKAVSTLKHGEKGTTTVRTLGGDQEMLTVNEPGLYRLIFKSRKAASERMKDWVFSVVLPSIRKTGNYSIAPIPVVPQLPSRELALETAVAIDRIQDILSKSNPRLAQILIDCAMNDIVESSQPKLAATEFPEDRWHSLVSIAEKMGIKTNSSTRTSLGLSVAKKGLERVQEERLCNGEMRPIWCYRDNAQTRQAIDEWADSLAEM
jgi:prophage antirepressor-like protein